VTCAGRSPTRRQRAPGHRELTRNRASSAARLPRPTPPCSGLSPPTGQPDSRRPDRDGHLPAAAKCGHTVLGRCQPGRSGTVIPHGVGGQDHGVAIVLTAALEYGSVTGYLASFPDAGAAAADMRRRFNFLRDTGARRLLTSASRDTG